MIVWTTNIKICIDKIKKKPVCNPGNFKNVQKMSLDKSIFVQPSNPPHSTCHGYLISAFSNLTSIEITLNPMFLDDG